MSNIGKVQEFKTRPTMTKAIQFTGKNGKDVVEFLKGAGFECRNGGSYISVIFPDAKHTVRKGEIAAVHSSGLFGIFTLETFKEEHTISKTHEFM